MRVLVLAAALGACVRSAPAPRAAPVEPAPPSRRKSFCPPGTYQVGERPPAGTSVHCERASGLKHGPYIYWFDSGLKEEEGSYHDGETRGRRTIWDAQGSVLEEKIFGAPVIVCAYDRVSRRAVRHLPVTFDGPTRKTVRVDDSGQVTVKMLPVGPYQLEWWSGVETHGPSTRAVVVDIEREQTVHAELDVSQLPPVVLGGPSPCAPRR